MSSTYRPLFAVKPHHEIDLKFVIDFSNSIDITDVVYFLH